MSENCDEAIDVDALALYSWAECGCSRRRGVASVNTCQNLVRVDKLNWDRLERNLEEETDPKIRGCLEMIMEFCEIWKYRSTRTFPPFVK